MSEKIDRLIDEISGVRNAVEELYLVLGHLWRNREELRGILTDKEWVVVCNTCDRATQSVEEAVEAGWTNVAEDEDDDGATHQGTCEECTRDTVVQQREQSPSKQVKLF